MSQEWHSAGVLSALHSTGEWQKSSACGALHRNGEVHARNAGLPKQLWPYALSTSFYVKNRCFHSAHNSEPYEMFFGEMPNLSGMQPFGCRAFVRTENRKKLDSKAQTGIFFGLLEQEQVFHRCADGTPEGKPSKIWTSKNVTFNMGCLPGSVTSVDTELNHDRCVKTTLHYDTRYKT